MIRVTVYGGANPEFHHFDSDEDALTWLVRNTSDTIREMSVSVVAR